MNQISTRLGYAGILLWCIASLAYALYVQHVMGLDPCPLCILQRMAMMGIAAVAVVGLVWPKGRAVVSVLMLAPAGWGIATAARHVWIQNLPPEKVPECGAGFDFMREAFGLWEAIRVAFEGSGDCAEVDWSFVGLSMPAWVLIMFVGLAFAGLIIGFKKQP
jgi:disulfide bond formation protein DsbB